MFKIFFYRFLHFYIFNLNQLLKNKIEPIEPKLDFSVQILNYFLGLCTGFKNKNRFFKIHPAIQYISKMRF